MLEVIHLNRTAAAGALSASIAHELNQPLGVILSNAEAAEILLTSDPPDLAQVKEILGDIRAGRSARGRHHPSPAQAPEADHRNRIAGDST